MLTLDNMYKNNVTLVPYNNIIHHNLMSSFIAKHPQIWDQGFGSAYKPESSHEIHSFLETWHSGAEQVFAIHWNNEFVGCSGIVQNEYIDYDHVVTMGRTLINPDYWGKQINYLTKNILINKIFETDTSKIRVSIDINNQRSINSIQKVGFEKLEQRLSNTLGKDGKPYEVYVFELTKQAWIVQEQKASSLVAS